LIGCVAAVVVSLGAIRAAGAVTAWLAGPDPLSSLSLPDPRTLDPTASRCGWTLCMVEAPEEQPPYVGQKGAIFRTHDGAGVVLRTVQFQTPGAAQQALGEHARHAVMQLSFCKPGYSNFLEYFRIS
jgi:hypothetical protein